MHDHYTLVYKCQIDKTSNVQYRCTIHMSSSKRLDTTRAMSRKQRLIGNQLTNHPTRRRKCRSTKCKRDE